MNTASWRAPGVLENERFRTAQDFAEWAMAARLIAEPVSLFEPVIWHVRELRHGLHELLIRVARGEAPNEREVAWLNRWIRDCGDRVRLAPSAGDTAWSWEIDPGSAGVDPGLAMLALVVQSAVDLLRSPERSLLRLCANEQCGWFFLDRSRQRNRRWCLMRECGGKEKARRYRARRRGGEAGPAGHAHPEAHESSGRVLPRTSDATR